MPTWVWKLYSRNETLVSVIANVALAAVASYLFLVFTRNRCPLPSSVHISLQAYGTKIG